MADLYNESDNRGANRNIRAQRRSRNRASPRGDLPVRQRRIESRAEAVPTGDLPVARRDIKSAAPPEVPPAVVERPPVESAPPEEPDDDEIGILNEAGSGSFGPGLGIQNEPEPEPEPAMSEEEIRAARREARRAVFAAQSPPAPNVRLPESAPLPEVSSGRGRGRGRGRVEPVPPTVPAPAPISAQPIQSELGQPIQSELGQPIQSELDQPILSVLTPIQAELFNRRIEAEQLPKQTPALPPLPKVPGRQFPDPDQIRTDYSNLGSDDQVFTDEYSPAELQNYTYNRQQAIKRYELSNKIRQDRQKIVLRDKGFAPPGDDDLLSTNHLDYSFTNENTVATLPNNQLDKRYYQETYRLVNVSSRQRQKYQERPVIAADRDTFPNKEIWDEFFNPDSEEFENIDLCCLTFNQLLGFDQEFPNFFIKEGQLWFRAPKDLESNKYTILIEPVPRHIRYVRLRGVEVPNDLDVINKYNNLLMLDVLDPCNDNQSFPWPDDLPFALMLIPVGSYTIESLLDTIVGLLNGAIRQFRECDPFSYRYVPQTGEITFLCEFQFHLRFWFSTTHPQFNLWEMLGFPGPFPVDENGEPAYVTEWSNLVSEPSPLTSLGLTNKVPYKKPQLDVHDYVYLSIRHLDVIQDPSVTGKDLYAKIRIVSNPADQAILSTKVFFEPKERMESLEIEWLDAFGNLVDFNGQENSFMIEFVEYQDKLKDSEFSTLRGVSNYDPNISRVVYKFNPN